VGAIGIIVERGLELRLRRDETFQLLLTFAGRPHDGGRDPPDLGTSPRSTSGLYLTYGQLRLFARWCGLQPDRHRGEPRHRALRSVWLLTRTTFGGSSGRPPTTGRWPRHSASTCAGSTPGSSRWEPRWALSGRPRHSGHAAMSEWHRVDLSRPSPSS